jgi:FkbM family methyltransferase
MKNPRNQLHAIGCYILGRGVESQVPPKWLLRSSSICNNRFRRRHAENIAAATCDESFRYVQINGQSFVWPRQAPVETLTTMLSEILQPDHPHFYDVPPTTLMPGDTVLDIGCCEGTFSAYAAEKGATVFSIEPSVKMAAVIERLFELRKLERPHITQCLLGSEEDTMYFLDDEENPGGSRIVPNGTAGAYPVQCLTLAGFSRDVVHKKVDYIKCDAEGADYEIIKSGAEMIKRDRPKIAITTYHNYDDYRKISGFLGGLGYRCTPKGLLFSGDRYRPLMLHGVSLD